MTDSGNQLLPMPAASVNAMRRDLDRFTGKRLPPKKYQAILKALVLGEESIASIAKRLRCSPSTIMAIRAREKHRIGDWKVLTARRLEEFITLGVERMAREVDSINLSQLPIAVGIAVDKKASLEGDAVAVVEHRHSVDLDALIGSLSPPEITVEVIEPAAEAPPNADATRPV